MGDRTLRDWFAGQALAGLLSGIGAKRLTDVDPPSPAQFAKWANQMADAMLAARDRDTRADTDRNARLAKAGRECARFLAEAIEELSEYEADATGESYNKPRFNDALAAFRKAEGGA